MTKAKTTPYNVFYSDGQYFTYDLTRQEFDNLCECVDTLSTCRTSFGVIVTRGIRAVVEKKPDPVPEREERPALPLDLDDATRVWLQENLSDLYSRKEVDYSGSY